MKTLLEFAEELNGIQYREERIDCWKQAKNTGVVVVFGASDDLV